MSETKTKFSQDCVVVLGMHRSGTSALAGMLSLLGCATPASLIKGDKNNEKGYFESNSVGRLSDKIMQELGSQWNDWLPLEFSALAANKRLDFGQKIQETIAAEYSETPLFVLKEPRMCRMVPFWHDAIQASGAKVHFVLTHRNPQEVATSLNRRDGFEPAYGYLLWMRHVLDAESATRGLPRIFTSYAQLMENWRGVVGKLDAGLGLPFAVDRKRATREIDGFLSQRLKHNTDVTEQTLRNPDLPKLLRDTFAVMERWAESGEQTKDHASLDALRVELDGLANVFGPLARPGQMALLENQRLGREDTDKRSQNTELNSAIAEVTRLRRVINVKRGELKALNQTLALRDNTLQEHLAEIDRLRSIITADEPPQEEHHADDTSRDKSIER